MEQHQSAQDEAPHSDFLMLVQDDSMKNAGIRAGDRVEIAACDHVEPGQIALVKVGGEYLLRVLWEDGQILAPANPAYMAEVFTRDELAGVQIKGGEFYTAYFSDCNFGGERCDALGLFKSETRDTFLDVEQQAGGVHIAAREGIDIKRLDKGAVIFNTEREEGFAVFVVDNTNRTEARYWIDDFLRVRQRQDNYHNTHNTLAMCKKYVTKHLSKEFEVSKADQAELLNETMKYFQEQESFSMDDFSEKVIRQPEVVESFTRFRQEYEQDRDIRIEDEFGISDSAVKKQARSYKSVIKLDRNFHIYVHGNRNLLEQGEDEKGKFYKVYYEEEE